MLLYCHKCYSTEQQHYIYNDNADSQTIYCPKCANKERRKICFVCGNIMKLGSYFGMYIKSGRNRAQLHDFVCYQCIVLHDEEYIRKKKRSPSNMGVYCGHCQKKKCVYKYSHTYQKNH